MATVGDHLRGGELEERFVGCQDATASRHFQVIWLLARGHTVSQVSATTAFGERCIEQLLAPYNRLESQTRPLLLANNDWGTTMFYLDQAIRERRSTRMFLPRP